MKIEQYVFQRMLIWSIVAFILGAATFAMNTQAAVSIILIERTSETTGEPVTLTSITQNSVEDYRGPSISSIDDIHTQEDLINYAATLLREDSSIQSITIGTDSISMTYSSAVRIVNFGMRNIDRTVTITSVGDISVSKPWYAQIVDAHAQLAELSSGFSDLAFSTDSDSISPAFAARLLLRMHGRLQIGAL